MKKFLIPFMSLFLLSSTPYYVYAQTDLEKAAAIGVGILGALFSSKKSKSSNTSDNSSTTTSYNSVPTTNSAYTQEDGIKIVTGHPDLKLQIKRCAASGKTVVIDMIITNKSGNDFDAWADCRNSTLYDSEGNTYSCLEKFGNQKSFNLYSNYTFISDVPVKVQLRVTDFSTTAESIARVDFSFACQVLGLNNDHKIIIRNIPISRE